MTMQDILAKVASKELSADDAAKLIGALSPARAPQVLTMKVSEKGAISVYGLQRMPVTLYVEQWERLLEYMVPGCSSGKTTFGQFAKAHPELTRKRS
jgi:hypothetical protein